MSFMEHATTHPVTLPVPLPDELARCAWAQWSINGHDIDTALRTVAAGHFDHEIRALAAQARRLAKKIPMVRAAYESVFWQRERESR